MLPDIAQRAPQDGSSGRSAQLSATNLWLRVPPTASEDVNAFRSAPTYRESMSIDDEGRAPICPFCGVTALPGDAGHVLDPRFICENPDCEAFGEVIESG
jgi:hypothetical protein